jgi:uncharacterized phage-like protein YoqJ
MSPPKHFRHKSQCIFSEPEGTPKVTRCAYLLFDASYNLAIAQWIGSQYFSQQDELIEVQTAINLIDFIGKYKESDYEYPHHIQQANCYVSKPSQACFDLYTKQ